MAINTHLTDSKNGRNTKVVIGNALAVNPPHPSIAFNAELATDDVVVNIVPAEADKVFCITDVLLTGNKNIDQTTAATVTIFTGDSELSVVADALSTLLIMPVARSSSRDITGILVETETGKWVNGVTSDDDVFVTILGYYLKADL